MKQGIWTIYFHVKKNNFWDQQILPEHWLIIQNYFLESLVETQMNVYDSKYWCQLDLGLKCLEMINDT